MICSQRSRGHHSHCCTCSMYHSSWPNVMCLGPSLWPIIERCSSHYSRSTGMFISLVHDHRVLCVSWMIPSRSLFGFNVPLKRVIITLIVVVRLSSPGCIRDDIWSELSTCIMGYSSSAVPAEPMTRFVGMHCNCNVCSAPYTPSHWNASRLYCQDELPYSLYNVCLLHKIDMVHGTIYFHLLDTAHSHYSLNISYIL